MVWTMINNVIYFLTELKVPCYGEGDIPNIKSTLCVGRLLSCVVFSFLERDLPVTEDLMHSDFKINLLF